MACGFRAICLSLFIVFFSVLLQTPLPKSSRLLQLNVMKRGKSVGEAIGYGKHRLICNYSRTDKTERYVEISAIKLYNEAMSAEVFSQSSLSFT